MRSHPNRINTGLDIGDSMNKLIRIAALGIATWLIPFIASIFFFTPQGGLTIGVFLFKTIMIVIGSAVGAVMIILYFKEITKDYLKEGIKVGLAWFAINIALDLVILLPMMGTTIQTYFEEIGLRYLVLPMMMIMAGYLLQKKA